MKSLRWLTTLSAFAIVGFVTCAHEGISASDPQPVTAADLPGVLGDEWSRHLFSIRNVVLDNAKNDLRSQHFAEKAVAANTRDLARTFGPFYGKAASDPLHTLLTRHCEAVKAYSLASVGGNPRQQDSTTAQLISNIGEIALSFNRVNPHLTTQAAHTLFATHIDYHVAQVNKFEDKD